MKKLLTTLLILGLIFPSIFSQNYFNASSTWQEDYFAANIPTIVTEKYEHLVNGDTMINSLSYMKIYRIGTQVIQTPGSSTIPTEYNDLNEYVAAIREEDQKVFFIPEYSTTNVEEVLYDFNWEVGDTVKCTSGCITIISVGTIDYGNETRKLFTLNGGRTLIEGIGFDTGLFRYPQGFIESGGQLICYSKDDIIYPVSEFGGCELMVDNENIPDNEEETISISPNPAINEIRIISENETSDTNIKIYNSFGHLITDLQNVQLSNSPYIIGTDHFANGIYFINIESENNSKTFKVIKPR